MRYSQAQALVLSLVPDPVFAAQAYAEMSRIPPPPGARFTRYIWLPVAFTENSVEIVWNDDFVY